MQKKLPLGIFDSGFGGLSVAKSIHKLLPQEDLIYIADSAFTPYGDMKESDILKRALLISATKYRLVDLMVVNILVLLRKSTYQKLL